MRLGMGRSVLLLILVSPLCAEVAATTPEPAPAALETLQTILEANRYLVDKMATCPEAIAISRREAMVSSSLEQPVHLLRHGNWFLSV